MGKNLIRRGFQRTKAWSTDPGKDDETPKQKQCGGGETLGKRNWILYLGTKKGKEKKGAP